MTHPTKDELLAALERDLSALRKENEALAELLLTIITPGFFSSPKSQREPVLAKAWAMIEGRALLAKEGEERHEVR